MSLSTATFLLSWKSQQIRTRPYRAFRITVKFNGGRKLIFISKRVPSREELVAWVERYEEETLNRFPRDPLIVDMRQGGGAQET